MTKRRFTSHQLYMLRNDIPIDALIEKALYIPSRVADGYFRFLCPSCKEFNTAVNPETNLARCFRCEQNFNTIELVMAIRKLNFVESVRFLQDYHKNASAGKNGDCRKDATDRSEPPEDSTIHIGKVLDRVLPSRLERIPGDCNQIGHQNMANDRISRLEHKVDRLFHQIENILKLIHIDNPFQQ